MSLRLTNHVHENQRDRNLPPILNLGMDRRVPPNLHMDRRGFLTPPEGICG
ncbi:MAG: hypothetical protein HZA08_08935 [Nitrospirae bacterium]|nr:hypothetical protein [Nitrospirota bacterium]